MNVEGKRLNLSWWWGFIIIGKCFISLNETSTTNHGIRDLFYYEIDFMPILLAVLLFMFFITVFRKAITNENVVFDNIFLLLILRLALTVIPSLYMTEVYYWGNIISYAVAPLIYFIIINRGVCLKNIVLFVKVFAVICIVQCVILFMSTPVPYTDILYKYYFVAPVGASNYLGCIMAMAFTIIMYAIKGKRKWIWFLIGLLGIFFTKSRTGLFSYILLPCIAAVTSTIKEGTISVKLLRRVGIIIAILLIGGFVFAGEEMSAGIQELVESLINGFTSSGTDITSGRIEQFNNQISIATKHPLFGAGFTFGDSHGAMHNFILESFYVSGIAGLIVQIALLINISKYVKYQNNKLGWILISVFMVALFEKILFTVFGEFILWSLVGVIYNETRRLRKVNA